MTTAATGAMTAVTIVGVIAMIATTQLTMSTLTPDLITEGVEKLGRVLRPGAKAFIAIPGMRTLEDVNQAMASGLGADQYTGMARFWQVVPAQAKR